MNGNFKNILSLVLNYKQIIKDVQEIYFNRAGGVWSLFHIACMDTVTSHLQRGRNSQLDNYDDIGVRLCYNLIWLVL